MPSSTSQIDVLAPVDAFELVTEAEDAFVVDDADDVEDEEPPEAVVVSSHPFARNTPTPPTAMIAPTPTHVFRRILPLLSRRASRLLIAASSRGLRFEAKVR
jgi:hypothetical protein